MELGCDVSKGLLGAKQLLVVSSEKSTLTLQANFMWSTSAGFISLARLFCHKVKQNEVRRVQMLE